MLHERALGAHSELIRQLRELPPFTPDPNWKQGLRARLLALAVKSDRMTELRHWAVYATLEPDPTWFGDVTRSLGAGWKPVAVQPARLKTMLGTIFPDVVIVDSRLPDSSRLMRETRGLGLVGQRVLSDIQLRALCQAA
jgi:hypothetical protein